MKQKFSWDEATKLAEVKALQRLSDHPNLIKIKEVVLNDKLNIVFEYCDKNLFQEMMNR